MNIPMAEPVGIKGNLGILMFVFWPKPMRLLPEQFIQLLL